uniref:Uncharacterized protein n=1 Tax=Calcidiscus leptoporus TaxID=127549 RepID=A0A7S0JHF6_9EUKA|mmetsp:Transcript_56769/g.130363  ORF Transcript_56769/g.130363 Transcript_56769/m.130363 type:complete len:206 (+) Transcript_56769:35-652(+)
MTRGHDVECDSRRSRIGDWHGLTCDPIIWTASVTSRIADLLGDEDEELHRFRWEWLAGDLDLSGAVEEYTHVSLFDRYEGWTMLPDEELRVFARLNALLYEPELVTLKARARCHRRSSEGERLRNDDDILWYTEDFFQDFLLNSLAEHVVWRKVDEQELRDRLSDAPRAREACTKGAPSSPAKGWGESEGCFWHLSWSDSDECPA